MATRRGKYNNPTHDFEPSKQQKNLEAIHIASLTPSLKGHLKSIKLLFFLDMS